MAEKNYYDILGVDKKASEADIKKAYRKLVRHITLISTTHPMPMPKWVKSITPMKRSKTLKNAPNTT